MSELPIPAEFAVGDVWRGPGGTRTILAVYERDVLVAYEYEGGRTALSLPKRLFSSGCCGSRWLPVEQEGER